VHAKAPSSPGTGTTHDISVTSLTPLVIESCKLPRVIGKEPSLRSVSEISVVEDSKMKRCVISAVTAANSALVDA
jgi:hypothetical protein